MYSLEKCIAVYEVIHEKVSEFHSDSCLLPFYIVFSDRFCLSFFVATRGFRDSGFEFCINPRKKVDHVCILVRH